MEAEFVFLTDGYFTNDDVDQLARIHEWETGKKPSRKIIRQKLIIQNREMTFGVMDEGLEMQPFGGTIINLEAIDELIEWSYEQSEEVQLLIFSFLDGETTYLHTYKQLLQLKLLNIKTQVKQKKMTVAQIITRALPETKDGLIQLVQQVSPNTKRPAATVRQWLRRNTRTNKVVLEGEYYAIVQKA